MIGKLIAMVVGSRIDRADGQGGLKGAAAGLIVERAVRGRFGPLGWFALGVVALWKLIFGRSRRRRSRR